VLPLIVAAFIVAGCQTTGNPFGDFTSFDWLNQTDPNGPATVMLARDPASLARGTAVEVALHNAVELSRQKRFVEARHLLAEVRSLQDRDSEGYRAISCSMALLALREGDLATFQRIASQLDESLGRPVRVEQGYVEVVSLYRTMSDRNLPVNAPEKMERLKERLSGSQSAQLQKGRTAR
jgi:hypothetical protein